MLLDQELRTGVSLPARGLRPKLYQTTKGVGLPIHCSGSEVTLDPTSFLTWANPGGSVSRPIPSQFCFWGNSVVFIPKEPPWSPSPNNTSISRVTHVLLMRKLRLREVTDSPKDTQRGLDRATPSTLASWPPVQHHDTPIASNAVSPYPPPQ